MTSSVLLYVVELFGISVFAVSGALSAGRKSMDTFGVIVIAFVTATGGGTIRDLLLDRHPVFWIGDRIYLAVILAVALSTVILTRFYRPPRLSLLVADAFGLGLFTIVGTRIAEEAGAPIVIAILMGAITGAAGGVLRDLLCDEIPLILRRDIYAIASLAGATIYIILEQVGLPLAVSATTGAAATFLLRLAAIKWNLQVPAFILDDDDS